MICFWMYGSQEGFGLAELCGSGPIHSGREPKLTSCAPTVWNTVWPSGLDARERKETVLAPK